MTNEYSEPETSDFRRRGRPGGTSNTAVLGIVLAAIALLAGFFVLRSIDSGQSAVGPVPETTDPLESETTEATTTTTTLPPDVFEGAVLQVVNANGIDGSAGQMSRTLEAAGFTVTEPTNAAASVGRLDASIIYYNAAVPGALAVAETLARVVGGNVAISPLPDVAPTGTGQAAGEVLFMLGNDKAGKTIEELNLDAAPVPAPEIATETGGEGDPDG